MATRKINTPASADSASAPQGYTVLARRYRPQQFQDLVGQEAVVRSLVNSLKSNRVAHAYLFTGARGVGKTTTARILAKALNCRKGPTETPCDECDICKCIATGEDVDVLEIDGASNRGIDEVREIRSNVQYRPSRARYKIYIIDEVHMLTKEAFNALLKTLEEPPPHVKFFFATTEAQKIPVTILSRCQRFDLGGIGVTQIVDRLRLIVTKEKLKADDEALEFIARRAAGSMRDAQSLLDQLLAFAEDKLTVEQVHGLLGTAGEDRMIELAAAVLEHDPARALALLAQAADEGLQLGELLDQLIGYWRDLMVVQCTGDESQILSVAARRRSKLHEQAKALKLDTILAGLDVLNNAKGRMRFSNQGRLLLEMALVRLGRLDDLASLSQIAQWIGQAPKTAGTAASAVRATPPEAEKKKPVATPAEPSADSLLPLSEESLPTIWQQILGKTPPVFAGLLVKAGLPAISGPNSLVLRFPAGYTHELEYCGDVSRVARMEDELAQIIGRRCKLRVELAPDSQPALPPSTNDEGPRSRPRGKRSDVPLDVVTKRAMEVLEAHLLQRDDDFSASNSPPDMPVEARNGER
jgi:DNA polymerase-3 subunit gamma/tau